jgi:hypothetical protein
VLLLDVRDPEVEEPVKQIGQPLEETATFSHGGILTSLSGTLKGFPNPPAMERG